MQRGRKLPEEGGGGGREKDSKPDVDSPKPTARSHLENKESVDKQPERGGSLGK